MKKSTKRFTLTSEAKNQEGFHVYTNGVDLTDFKDNPIMLWMHTRPSGGSKDEVLPLGYWADIEVKDGKITAVPVFDDSDEFAMKIYQKVENGTIKMASAGLRPIEWNQDNTWLKKSVLKEASIVDIGSNREALGVALYNEVDQLVKLADITVKSKSHINMKLIQLSAATTLPLLKLQEGATEADVHTAILNLVTLSQSQKNEIQKLKDSNKELNDKIELAEKASSKKKCVELADKAISERKITADQKGFIIKLAEADFDNASKYVDSLKGADTVANQINQETPGASEELKKLSYDELDKSGKLIKLKAADPEAFKTKFKERFGTEYKG
jgi:hypothetical protein